jgi:hypothetical protein
MAMASPAVLNAVVEETGPELLRIVNAVRVQPLNRYNIRKGRIFGNPLRKERYRVIDVSSNTIMYKDLLTDKIESSSITNLLESWNLKGIQELSPIDEILNQIKSMLTPFLGGVLVATIMSWLSKRL